MAEYIKMPTLGFDMEEGTMGVWLKQVGDKVQKGDVLAEIESDKVTQELQARADGVLLAQLVKEGDNVPVGDNLGIIGEEGEDISNMTDGQSPPPKEAVESETGEADKPDEAEAPAESPSQAAGAAAAGVSGPDKTPAAGEPAEDGKYPGGVKATPVARRVASEHQVDLKQVQGSGPEGRIRKADVEAFLEQPRPSRETAAPAAPAEVPTGADVTEVELTRLRKAIARRMVQSRTTVPHFYVTTEIDMEAALALRKQINAKLPDESKVTVNDLIVKAAALALRDFPNINASFAEDKLIRHNQINIGSAVAVEGGLLTVVQKNTDTATLSKIAADNKEMIARAREGKVRGGDVEGATFTVSNLGAFDVDHFIAIINPPEAAILAVGSARKVPVVDENGELTVGTRMKATISADHRVTDGAEAARYLQTVKGLLEEPLRLLL